MIKNSGHITFNRKYDNSGHPLISGISKRTIAMRLVAVVVLVLFLCPMTEQPITDGPMRETYQIQPDSSMQRWLSAESTAYSGLGATQSVTLNGVYTNNSQGLVLLDSSTPTPVSISSPQDWTGNSLTGTMEHISTQFAPIKNGLLDSYHTERTIISGSPWNAMDYNVPDDWNIIEEGETYNHPYYGRLFFHSYSGDGREGSMGWRFNTVFGTTNTIYPDMEIYLTQHVQLPYREISSAQVSIYYYVRSVSSMNDYFYLFIRFGGYETELHVFESGDVTDQWIKQTVDIPMSAFESYAVPGSLDLDIGIATDYSGMPSTAVDNQIYLDQVELILEARPLPEQIGLSANQTIISGSTSGSISQYVPDGAARDCFSRSDTGIDTSYALEAGVWSSSGTSWDDIVKYQFGIQFPLDIPQEAIITYATLEVEALGYFGGGDNSLRVFVAEEDNLSPFTDGLPNLEDRYSWSQTSVDWIQDSWQNGYRYQTQDLSSLVQTVVSRSGWSSGNYIGLMIDYMDSDQYRDWNSIKGTYGYGGSDLAVLNVDFLIPQESDSIDFLSYKKDITIDHTMVAADLTDFPLLVDIFDTDLKTKAQTDGDDIIFKSDGRILPHEIELFEPDFNSTHAHLVSWIRTDLSSSVDTEITMLYGNPDISSQQNPSDVWSQNYMGVWHLGETSGGSRAIEDSTLNKNHGTDAGSPTFGTNGSIGKAITFDGLDDLINCDNGPSLRITGDAMTIEAWVYLNEDTPPQWGTGIAEKDGSYSLMQDWDGSRKFTFSVTASSQTWTSHENNDLYRWYHVVGVYDGSNTYVYVDGIQRNSYANTGPIVETINPLYIGRGDQYFDGRIDEVRILNIEKPVEWILTEFRNQNDPASFMGVGIEQNVQYGTNATLLFTTEATSVVSILPRLDFDVTAQRTTYGEDMQPGTSFAVNNGTSVTWAVNTLVSPPPGVSDVNLTMNYPTLWTFQGVTDPIGNVRTSEVSSTATQVFVQSSVIDAYGIWSFSFTSTNEASNLECSAGGSPYAITAEAEVGQSLSFRGTASIISGSAMRLVLVDPNDQVFYATDDLSQDGSGRFEWTGIAVDSSWPRGEWTAYVDFNETAGAAPIQVGRYSRDFVVKHDSSLDLQSPGDAVGDQLSVKIAGDLLLVEVNLTDTDTLERVSGSTVTMNWTVSGAPTQI
ncbi:MAG: LamG-like jellyroll fold domain-containing protein, partial [Candidatus Thorarchaeota archaeon]